MKNSICFSLTIGMLLTVSSMLLVANTANAANIENGKSKFATLCATCHGPLGAGDGPVSAAMPADQKPANFATGQMKYAKDEATFKELIKKGGAAVGLSPLMPPQPGLSESDISDLYAFVKSLHK